MPNLRPRSSALRLCAALAPLVAALSPCPSATAHDLRVQLWNFYQWNEDGSRQDKIVFRAYQDIGLGGDWSVTFREELPLLLTDKTGPANPDGAWSSGLGDAFVQAVVSTPEILPGTRLQVGLRAVFPTGGEGPFGGNTYQLGPMAGLSHRIEGIAGGLLLAPRARYLISVARTDADAKEVRKLQIYPHVALTLSESWLLEFWQDEPVVYDRITREWFVPFDATLSWRFAPGATLKVGGSVNLTDNTSQYRHVLHSALSFSF